MTLKPKFLLILSLFQLSLGLGWIFGYLLIPPTVFFYEQAAVRALQKEYHTVRTEGLNSESDIVLQPYEFFNKGQTAPLPVVSLHRESALNSFPTYPPNPMDYTVLFRHLYEQGARNVYAIAPMAWEEEPDNIVKSAVGYELDRFRHKALGRQMSESSRRASLPSGWKHLAIPPGNIIGKTDQFPRADRLVGEEPQITTEAGTLGTVVENSDLFSASQESGKSFPLFVRWGEDIIPTLPLVAALNALDLDPEDVRLIPGDTLLLGNSRSIPLDEYGRIPLAENSGPTLLDTQEVIVPVMSGLRPPDMSAVRKLLSGRRHRFRTLHAFRGSRRPGAPDGENHPQHHGSPGPGPGHADSGGSRLGAMGHCAGRTAAGYVGPPLPETGSLAPVGLLHPVRSRPRLVPFLRTRSLVPRHDSRHRRVVRGPGRQPDSLVFPSFT